MKKILALLVLVMSLAACQASPALPLRSSPTPAPLTGGNASQAGASALLLLANPNGGNMLVPVSAASGQPVKGFTPVDFGRNIAYAFSSDRTRLAFASSGIAGCAGVCLHVLDLHTWKETLSPVTLSQDTLAWSLMAYQPDGSQVAIAFNDPVKPASRVALVDLAQEKIIQAVDLSQGVNQMAFTPDGGLALYGNASFPQGKEIGIRVLLLDGSSLQTTWQQDLEMIQISDENQVNLADPSQGEFLIPALSFSADGSRLVAVPADQDTLVSVDFVKRTLYTSAIQPPRSLLERLLTFGAARVYAKSLNGAYKIGMLSPDGSRYYVTGQTSTAVKDANGEWTAKTTPLGLQVIRTSDGAELARQSNGATELNLSLDGKFILLTHWLDQPDTGYGQPVTEVMDAATFKVNLSIQGVIQPTRLLDGSQAWLSWEQLANGSTQLAIYTPGAQNPRSQWSKPVNDFVSWIPIP